MRLAPAVNRFDNPLPVAGDNEICNVNQRKLNLVMSGKTMLAIALNEYIRAYDNLMPRPLVRQIHKYDGTIVITDNGKPYWFQQLPASAGREPPRHWHTFF